jgi:hypothetical protein
MEPESLFPFLKKLKEKKQEEYKVKQASDAVSIFYDNFKEKQFIDPPNHFHLMFPEKNTD